MRFLFFAFSISLVLSFTACQKEASFDPNNPNGSPGAVSGNMKAKINGVQWTADRGAGAARFSGIINISGVSSDKKFITITLTDSGVHRYILSDVTINAGAFTDSAETNPFGYATNQGDYPTQCGGEVNITSIDAANKTISGSFSFKIFRQMDGKGKTITEGSFTNMKYTTTMPQASTTDTFRVKINGTSWTPYSIMGSDVAGQLIVSATDATAVKTVGLIMPADVTPGSYNLDFFGMTYIGQYNPDSDPAHSKASMSGTLTVLENNKTTRRLRANFAFRGEELFNSNNFANITEGYLSVKY
jgi:hypothetical protein